MLTQAGVEFNRRQHRRGLDLGARDPLIDVVLYPTKARNGVIDGAAAVLCYSGRSVTPVATWQTAVEVD